MPLEAHLRAQLSELEAARAPCVAITLAFWKDIQRCDAGHPGRLCETEPLHAPEAYDPKCAACLLDGVSPISYTVPDAVRADVLERGSVADVRQTWVSARDSLAALKLAVAHRAQLGKMATQKRVAREDKLAERTAFCVYTAVMFDVVRPAVLAGDTRAAFVAAMAQFTRDAELRYGSRQRIPRLWCPTHKRVGHAMPSFGRDAYRECGVCLRDAKLCAEVQAQAVEIH
ncbi:MAG: hypothetical protein Q7V62_07840 [Actinomycetota bacterium]|nr:hypothetical protein [Actinomycetota bacterium]